MTTITPLRETAAMNVVLSDVVTGSSSLKRSVMIAIPGKGTAVIETALLRNAKTTRSKEENNAITILTGLKAMDAILNVSLRSVVTLEFKLERNVTMETKRTEITVILIV